MPDDSPRTLGIACGLGRRLVVVLLRRGRIGALALPQGREVHGGDGIRFVGGPLMIVLMALVFRLFLKRRLVDEARAGRRIAARSAGWKATPRWTCPCPSKGRFGGA